MIKKENRIHYSVIIFWLVLVSVLRWNLHQPFLPQLVNLIFLWLGAALGTALFDIDHLVYTLFFNPQELTSLRIKKFLEQKQVKEAILLLADTCKERRRMVFHSVLFQLILVPFSFFVVTSTGSLFGIGLVMGLFLHSLVDQAVILRSSGGLGDWFWQIKAEIPFKFQKIYYAGMIVFFVIFTFIMVF